MVIITYSCAAVEEIPAVEADALSLDLVYEMLSSGLRIKLEATTKMVICCVLIYGWI